MARCLLGVKGKNLAERGYPLYGFDWHILLRLLKARNPLSPWYLPYPLSPTPPNGRWQLSNCITESFTTKAPELVCDRTE